MRDETESDKDDVARCEERLKRRKVTKLVRKGCRKIEPTNKTNEINKEETVTKRGMQDVTKTR